CARAADADVRHTVRRIGLAGGVAGAGVARVRRGVTESAAQAVAGGAALARHADVVDAEVLRAVGAQAGAVAGAGAAVVRRVVADLAAAALGGVVAGAGDAGPADAE